MIAQRNDELVLQWAPDKVGATLGTGCMRFVSNYGIDGLAINAEPRIDVLAVVSADPGKGHFREFVRALKRQYDQVRFFAIFNPVVGKALKRYNFTPCKETAWDGDVLEGMQWERRKN
jgi:hypothetical protein